MKKASDRISRISGRLFRTGSNLPTKGNESTVDILRENIIIEHQDDIHQQIHSMRKFLPSTLSWDDFEDHLKRYPSYVRRVYKDAEEERFTKIPSRLDDRISGGGAYLQKVELMHMDYWTQKRGALRQKEAHKKTADDINENDGSFIEDRTKKAFQLYRREKNIVGAIRILQEIKGVDLARASLLLSTAFPNTLPFCSDSLYQWMNWNTESGWSQSDDWNEENYQKISQKVNDLANTRYSRHNPRVKAIDVEKVAFVLKQEIPIRIIRNEALVMSLFEREEPISRTDNSYVYRLTGRQGIGGDNGSVIIKRICKTPPIDETKNAFLTEVSSSRLLAKKHPYYFVQLFGWNEDASNLFVSMEDIKLGDLNQNLDCFQHERDVKEITRQLLDGLKIMHGYGIVHRDLKPQNILVISKPPESIRVKITDFGISKRLSRRATTALVTYKIGTSVYKAPEVAFPPKPGKNSTLVNMDCRPFYTHKADLWSLGCVIYTVAKKEELFHDSDIEDTRRMKARVKLIKKKLRCCSSIGRKGVELVQKLIVVDPEQRSDIEEALAALSRW